MNQVQLPMREWSYMWERLQWLHMWLFNGVHGNALRIRNNECYSNPCGNGGIYEDVLNGYTCGCVTGYMGMHCESGTMYDMGKS